MTSVELSFGPHKIDDLWLCHKKGGLRTMNKNRSFLLIILLLKIDCCEPGQLGHNNQKHAVKRLLERDQKYNRYLRSHACMTITGLMHTTPERNTMNTSIFHRFIYIIIFLSFFTFYGKLILAQERSLASPKMFVFSRLNYSSQVFPDDIVISLFDEGDGHYLIWKDGKIAWSPMNRKDTFSVSRVKIELIDEVMEKIKNHFRQCSMILGYSKKDHITHWHSSHLSTLQISSESHFQFDAWGSQIIDYYSKREEPYHFTSDESDYRKKYPFDRPDLISSALFGYNQDPEFIAASEGSFLIMREFKQDLTHFFFCRSLIKSIYTKANIDNGEKYKIELTCQEEKCFKVKKRTNEYIYFYGPNALSDAKKYLTASTPSHNPN